MNFYEFLNQYLFPFGHGPYRDTFLFLSYGTILIYSILILCYKIGWKRSQKLSSNKYFPKITLVVSFRNEESNVSQITQSLKNQQYPRNQLEIIFVNDHSTDNTLNLLEKEQNIWDILRVINLDSGETGKKEAIQKAVHESKGDIIITTDADCSFNQNWIKTMAEYFNNQSIKLVSGPVVFEYKKDIFYKLQTLEFLSLIASGAGAIGINRAIFANGANLAYRKEVFEELNPFKHNQSPSGDDVFLLHQVKKKYPNGIYFAKNQEAIATTKPKESLVAFINQRKRWAGKSILYRDFDSIFVSILILFINLIILSLAIMCVFFPLYVIFLMCLLLYKSFFDIILLYPVLSFFKRRDLLKFIFPFQFVYPLYIVLISLFSFNNSFEWKERAYRL